MNRRSLSVAALALALAVPLVAASAQAASAAPSHAGKAPRAPVATGRHTPSAKTSGFAPQSALHGYQQVVSSLLTDTAGIQTFGSVACPTGTRLVGGGTLISSSSLSENLNSSVPSTDGLTWRAYVNNSSTTNGTFRVYADCVAKESKYSVVVGTGVDNPGGAQTTATVTCPKGTYPLGGGGYSSSSSPAVNLNTSIPTAKGWRTDINNNSTPDATAFAYAVCGKKPSGYVQLSGTTNTVNASSQGSASVSCPSGTLVFGGGGYSSSGSTAVDLNSSVPAGTAAWEAFENDGTTAASSLTAYAICAAASA